MHGRGKEGGDGKMEGAGRIKGSMAVKISEGSAPIPTCRHHTAELESSAWSRCNLSHSALGALHRLVFVADMTVINHFGISQYIQD